MIEYFIKIKIKLLFLMKYKIRTLKVQLKNKIKVLNIQQNDKERLNVIFLSIYAQFLLTQQLIVNIGNEYVIKKINNKLIKL